VYPGVNALSQYVYARSKVGGNSTGRDICIVSNYTTTSKIMGVRPVALKVDETYAAAVTANPQKPWYWNIYLDCPDQSKGVNVQVKVDVKYYAEMYQRKDPAISTDFESSGYDPLKGETGE